jgi:lipoic acid synthetase
MVGLGETLEELRAALDDLAAHGVSMLTIGQYLAPSKRHLPVARWYHPDEFNQLAEDARSCGIRTVVSAPLVRSSYLADVVLQAD